MQPQLRVRKSLKHMVQKRKLILILKEIIVMHFLYQLQTNIKDQELQFQQKLSEYGIKRALSNRKLSKKLQKRKLPLEKN